LYFNTRLGYKVHLDPDFNIDTCPKPKTLGLPINIIFPRRDSYDTNQPDTEDPIIAGAIPEHGVIGFFLVSFSGERNYLRQRLSEISIEAGTYFGELWDGIAQTVTHEPSHCFLNTRDYVYRWHRCVLLAVRPLPGVDPSDNADTISAIIFFLYCLVQLPEWDFSDGTARLRSEIPEWLAQYKADIIASSSMKMEPEEVGPTAVHLRNQDVVWRL
jgi:hypothetical protein